MKIVIGVSGASGVGLGLKAYGLLPQGCEKHLILSDHAKTVYRHEEGRVYDNADIAAAPASGSYGVDAMLIAPCSMNTLAKIACGIADNLITRAAAVMIKEKRRLVIAPREMPLDAIALENMLKLARLGVVIAPPMLAYYGEQNSLEAMENYAIGKWFDLLGLQNDLYKRWE